MSVISTKQKSKMFEFNPKMADQTLKYSKTTEKNETKNKKIVFVGNSTEKYYRKGLRKSGRPLNLHEIRLHKPCCM